MSPIRAITFDLDDTLWDIWPTIARAEQTLHDWLAAYYPRIPALYTPVELRELARDVLTAQPALAHDRTQVRKELLRLAAQRAGYTEFAVDAAHEVFYAARNAVLFFPDALPALERLARRFPLGALSNGNADIQRVGLGHVFAFAINAAQAGAPKPQPAMFEAACQRWGFSPAEIVHVGDDPELDVAGAARAGFRTVWVNRHGRIWSGAPRADAEIDTLADLEALLTTWER